MSQPHDNWLLLSLPEADQKHGSMAMLQQVRLEKGRPLYRPGEKTEYAYFPLDCLISTVYTSPHNVAAEIAVTGREGVVGLEVLLDDVAIPRLAIVQTSRFGPAYPRRGPDARVRPEPARARSLHALHAGAGEPDDAALHLQPAT